MRRVGLICRPTFLFHSGICLHNDFYTHFLLSHNLSKDSLSKAFQETPYISLVLLFHHHERIGSNKHRREYELTSSFALQRVSYRQLNWPQVLNLNEVYFLQQKLVELDCHAVGMSESCHKQLYTFPLL